MKFCFVQLHGLAIRRVKCSSHRPITLAAALTVADMTDNVCELEQSLLDIRAATRLLDFYSDR